MPNHSCRRLGTALPTIAQAPTSANPGEVRSTFADEWTAVSKAGSSPSVADMARKLGRWLDTSEGLLKRSD